MAVFTNLCQCNIHSDHDDIPDAVTTKQAKDAARPEVTAELEDLSKEICALSDRNDKLTKLRELKKTASSLTRSFLDITALREIQHYNFMKHILRCHSKEFMDDKVWEGRECHDYSKDELFYFAAASFFDGGVKTAESKQLKENELNRHYLLESHHPEYEKYHDRECSELDIIEMAIDRLARNVQFGNGLVNMNVLKMYVPTFPKGDNIAKQELFLKYCDHYAEMVQHEFSVMFPGSKEWAKGKEN